MYTPSNEITARRARQNVREARDEAEFLTKTWHHARAACLPACHTIPTWYLYSSTVVALNRPTTHTPVRSHKWILQMQLLKLLAIPEEYILLYRERYGRHPPWNDWLFSKARSIINTSSIIHAAEESDIVPLQHQKHQSKRLFPFSKVYTTTCCTIIDISRQNDMVVHVVPDDSCHSPRTAVWIYTHNSTRFQIPVTPVILCAPL